MLPAETELSVLLKDTHAQKTTARYEGLIEVNSKYQEQRQHVENVWNSSSAFFFVNKYQGQQGWRGRRTHLKCGTESRTCSTVRCGSWSKFSWAITGSRTVGVFTTQRSTWDIPFSGACSTRTARDGCSMYPGCCPLPTLTAGPGGSTRLGGRAATTSTLSSLAIEKYCDQLPWSAVTLLSHFRHSWLGVPRSKHNTVEKN